LDFDDACVFVQIIIKSILTAIGFVWSTRGMSLSLGSFVKSVMVANGNNFWFVASAVFMVQVIKEERRTLAVYPVFFFYIFIGWMILLQ
jgi:hypothetical protein